jgi:hypothetical protein
MPDHLMRRDLVVMGTLAAIAGIALAALLTASFGASSSGPPATLKPAVKALKPEAPSLAKATAARKAARAQRRRRVHRARQSTPAAPVQTGASVAQTQPSTTTPTQQQTTTQPQQQVTTPAPNPQPVRPLSRPTQPKRGSSDGGGTFDDSG